MIPKTWHCFRENLQFHFILFLSPTIYAFQITVLAPKLIVITKAGLIRQYVHIFLSAMCLINICGNMIMSYSTEVDLPHVACDSIYCEHCKKMRPAISWHCKKCNICIVKREHHCAFLAKCVGLYNKRYYLLFLGHVSIAMAYSTYFNYLLIASEFDEVYSTLIYIARILNPFIWCFSPEPFDRKCMYVLYALLNVVVFIWAGTLFFFHFQNAVMGVTYYEGKYYPELKKKSKWKQNLISVFGIKWYWAMLWPFCTSALPICVKEQ